jgi:hypothetical protein
VSDRLRLTGAGAPPEPQRIPAGALRVRGRIAEAMLALHAIAPEDAVDYSPEPRDVREFDQLRAANIVRDVPDGRYWFDLIAYHLRERARSRVATMWAFGIALVVAALAVLFYRG